MTPIPRPARPLQPSGAPPPLPGQRPSPTPISSNRRSQDQATTSGRYLTQASGPPPYNDHRAPYHGPSSSKCRPPPVISRNTAAHDAPDNQDPKSLPPGPPINSRRLPPNTSCYDRHASVMAALSEVRSNKEWSQRQGGGPPRGGGKPGPSPTGAPGSPRKRAHQPGPSGVYIPSSAPPKSLVQPPNQHFLGPRNPAISDHRKTAIALSRMPSAAEEKSERVPPQNEGSVNDVAAAKVGTKVDKSQESTGDTKSDTASVVNRASVPSQKNVTLKEPAQKSRGDNLDPPPAPAPAIARSPTSPAAPTNVPGASTEKSGHQVTFGTIEDRTNGSFAFIPTNLAPALENVWRERRKMVSLWQQQSGQKKRRTRGGWLDAVSMKGCSEYRALDNIAGDNPLESLIASFPFTIRDRAGVGDRSSSRYADPTTKKNPPAGGAVGNIVRAGRLFSIISEGTDAGDLKKSQEYSVIIVTRARFKQTFWDFLERDVDIPEEVEKMEEATTRGDARQTSRSDNSVSGLPPPPPKCDVDFTSPVPPPPELMKESKSSLTATVMPIPPPPPPPLPPEAMTDGVLEHNQSLPAILPVPVPPNALRIQSPALSAAILPSPFGASLVLPPPSIVTPSPPLVLNETLPPPPSPPPKEDLDSCAVQEKSTIVTNASPANEPLPEHLPPRDGKSPSITNSEPKDSTTSVPRKPITPEEIPASGASGLLRKPYGTSAVYRVWPKGCRFLILWGFETCALSHKASSSHIEQLLEFVRNSPEFTAVFGPPRGTASVQGVGNIDRKAAPFPVRWAQVDVEKTGESHQGKVVFRSLFSSQVIPSSDGKRWQGYTAYHAPGESRITRPDSLLSALIEFQESDQAAAFFFANTYSDVSDCWGGRLWSIPDYKGLKFWLHAILSNTGTWCKACLPQTLAQSTLNPSLCDDPSTNVVFAPFLAEADAEKLVSSGLEFEKAQEGSGYHVKVSSGVTWMQQSLTVPISDATGAAKTPPKLSLLVQSTLIDWATNHLGANPGFISCWARVAKYVHRIWADSGVLTSEVAPAPTPTVVEVKKDAIPKKVHVEAKSTSNKPSLEKVVEGKIDASTGKAESSKVADQANKKDEEGSKAGDGKTEAPKHYVVRVALLVCSGTNEEVLLTPILLCSLDDFLMCRAPHVQKMVAGAKTPPKRDEATTQTAATTDSKQSAVSGGSAVSTNPPAARLKRKLNAAEPAGNASKRHPGRRTRSGENRAGQGVS